MKIWSVAAQKGGVGKTTTVVSMAGSLTRLGYSVLMVDLDPHGSLSGYFGFNCDVVEPNAYSLFEAAANDRSANIRNCIVADRQTAGLSLVPSSTALVSLDRRYGQRRGMGGVLKKCLTSVDSEFDYCLIDCPPVLGILVVNALVACTSLVVPVQTEHMAVGSIDRLLRTLDMIERSSGIRVPYTVVPTMFDRRTRASHHALSQIRERKDIAQWAKVIPVDTQFREASRVGLPLTSWQPRAKGSQAYEELLSDLLEPDLAGTFRKAG